MATPVWFITGCSNGFGLLLSLKALSAGHRVISTVRTRERSPDAVKLIEATGGKVVELEMTAPRETIVKTIQDAEQIYGRIDYLVNNAGYSVLGAVELFSEQQAVHQLQTNILGPLYAIQGALPGMRSRRSGTIVNFSSVAGQDGKEACGLYAASKFGLEGLSESLAKELAEFGISVLIVEPGAFRTNFLDASLYNDTLAGGPYAGSALEKALRTFASYKGKQAGDPQKGVDIIFSVVTGQGPAGHLKDNILRLPLGGDAFARIQTKVDKLTTDLEATCEIGITTNIDS